MNKEPRFGHCRPPIPTDKSLYNQKEPSEVTIEELMEYRKVPTYHGMDFFIQCIMALIFGPPKIILTVIFAVVADIIWMTTNSIWRTLGSPEEWRPYLMGMWSKMSRIAMFFLGFYRVRYHGEPDPDARFIVGNHVCFFDGWFLVPFGPRPICKKELLHIPGISDMGDVYRGIAVDRSKNNGLTKELVAAAKDKTTPPFMILPEGASTSGEYMLRFHLGAFLSDLPVQPVTFRYTLWGTSKRFSHISFFHNYSWHWLALLSCPAITLDVTFLESMDLKTHGNNMPRQFADSVALRIANELGVRYLSLGTGSFLKTGEIKKKNE